MDRPVRVAVIGAGGIANGIHLPALMEIEGAEVASICDHLPGRARAVGERFHIQDTRSNYLEMLDAVRPDAVFVLVQPDQSFRIALDCLKRGLATFVEKPAGITLYQAETLKRASQQYGALCQVGFNRRYVPLIRQIVSRMRTLGPIHQVEGCFFKHGDAAFYEGCASAFVCDTIHAIDTLRWIAAGTPTRAATLTMRNGGPVDDAWNSLIAFDNGVTGLIKANYQTGGRVHTFEIHSAAASAYINIGFGGACCDAKILYSGERGTHSLSAGGTGDFEIETLDGMKIAGSDQYHVYYGYKAEDEEFIRCARSGEGPLCDINEAVKTMELAEMMLAGQIN